MLQKQIGYLFIGLAVLELSFLPIISSVGASSIGTIPLLFLTFLVGSIVSFSLLLYKKRLGVLKSIASNRRLLAIIAIAGLLNFAFAQLFLTLGVLGTNPIIASLILKLWPIFMALMIPFTLKTKVNTNQLVALAIGFFGVYILITNGTLYPTGNLGSLIFVLFIFASTLATAVSNIIIRSQNYDMYVQVFLFNLASFLLFSMLIALGYGGAWFARISTYGIVSFLFLGCITYSLGAFMFFYALKVLNPLFAGNATYATPLLTILFSMLLLGTQLHLYYFYALAFILLALFIQQNYASKAPQYISRRASGKSLLYDVTSAFVNNKNSEISHYMQGSGRALAMKVNKNSIKYDNGASFRKDCIVFTNEKPHHQILREELDFVKEIIGLAENEIALIGIGKASSIEEAFNEII